MTDKVTTWLWCNGTAEEQARFYTALIPYSAIDRVMRAPLDYPGGAAGKVLTVEFTLGGRRFALLDGGPGPQHSEAMSLSVDCADQAEVDRYWDAFLADGGTEMQCGWLKDRWGVADRATPPDRADERPAARGAGDGGDDGDGADRRRGAGTCDRLLSGGA